MIDENAFEAKYWNAILRILRHIFLSMYQDMHYIVTKYDEVVELLMMTAIYSVCIDRKPTGFINIAIPGRIARGSLHKRYSCCYQA